LPVSAHSVFKRRHRLERIFRRAGENEFAVDLLDLAYRYRDIVPVDAQETAGPDYGVRDGLFGGDDDIIDRPALPSILDLRLLNPLSIFVSFRRRSSQNWSMCCPIIKVSFFSVIAT